MKKFEFKKSYEEIDVAGLVLRVSLKDDDRRKFGKQLASYHEILKEIKTVDTKEMNVDEVLVMEERIKAATLETIDVLFGEGKGQELYELAEEQTEELLPIIFGVAEIINERQQEKVSKYTKKKVK